MTGDRLASLVSGSEAAAIAGLKLGTFRKYVARGSAPAPVGVFAGRRVYDRAEIEAWAADRPGQGARTDRVRRRDATGPDCG